MDNWSSSKNVVRLGKSTTKWKVKTVATGNKLLDKIEWEEYSLKTVPDPQTTLTERVIIPSLSL